MSLRVLREVHRLERGMGLERVPEVGVDAGQGLHVGNLDGGPVQEVGEEPGGGKRRKRAEVDCGRGLALITIALVKVM